ncbi:SAP30 binding protein ortholog [Schizosaccharomyces pombe]|uniref:Meiotically up-regulated gene 151 protein n=1 Tax=Schizosaccharomyces pombe (strain 972 / ATCC 24843) TaxID=284812 RepID=MU151_SCHPO|nr:putative transcriptional regulator HCNGP-like protein [Schizosaccharomyces pombe]Q10069.1 RecName: Full=Meiotically up-regulated gene 151 protein [Schizosaccharomyces pombe 972h-]CAA92256.1 mouse transcriptional regulator, HCNGP-like (predicted) [Schizosaccharomyces pombe]|eukprot:NP_593545.1 putative transcriptional regulator HCNGP-like protein [Schizosaccharomyces pombe]
MSLVAYDSEEEEQTSLVNENNDIKGRSEEPHWKIPNSPKAEVDTELEKKIKQFIKLKAKGIHFHTRLSENENFRNPKLLDNLQDFLDIKEPRGTMISKDMWDPTDFHKNVYASALSKSQDEMIARRENYQKHDRTEIKFQTSQHPK